MKSPRLHAKTSLYGILVQNKNLIRQVISIIWQLCASKAIRDACEFTTNYLVG